MQPDPDWIEKLALKNVALHMLALHRYTPDSIDGPMLALFAKRLVKSELAVGGPYSDGNHADDFMTNLIIDRLFEAFKSPLPNVIAYVAARSELIQDIEPLVELTAKELGIIRKPRKKPSSGNEPSPVAQHVFQELQQLSDTLRPNALTMWESVLKADHKHEISLLSQTFFLSMRQSTFATDPPWAALGIANFYTWMAYTIYDDFIDDEGEPAKLPIANIMQRRAVNYYTTVANENGLQSMIVQDFFDRMDQANEWELSHARFAVSKGEIIIGKLPNYDDGQILADRAAGHILGPVLLSHCSTALMIPQKQAIEDGLRSYLIARQLNDDIHDWMEDLERGHISYVIAYLLKSCRITQGTYTIAALNKILQQYFWKTGLVVIAQRIIDECHQVSQSLETSKHILKSGPFLKTIIGPIKKSAEQSIIIHNDQKQFLKTYSLPK